MQMLTIAFSIVARWTNDCVRAEIVASIADFSFGKYCSNFIRIKVNVCWDGEGDSIPIFVA
jgi:hypothetical protein